MDPESCEVVYKDRSGRDARAAIDIGPDGVLTAEMPRDRIGGRLEYFFKMVDSEGGEVTYPTFAPQMHLTADVGGAPSILGSAGVALLGILALAAAIAGTSLIALRIARRRKVRLGTGS
jgi:hypothetical protein